MSTRARRLAIVLAAGVAAAPAPLAAQGLRHKISELFIFGEGDDPLFLSGSGDPNNPQSVRVHGNHYVPSAVEQTGSIIRFLTGAISGNVANVPIGATSGGETFRFEGGVPVRTSTSAGPIFAERAQTLGRGRVLAGLTRTSLAFRTFRGEDLRNLRVSFTHENVDFPGCSASQGGDCLQMGVPTFENDVIQVRLDVDVRVDVTAFSMTYGLTDRIDVGVVVPVVSTALDGTSVAEVVPFGPPPVAHFFGGTQQNPVLTASRTVRGDATGLGDVAVRLKANVRDVGRTRLALLGDARFATGSAEDLLGSGRFLARALAIFSSSIGAFSPHANVGYLFRQGGEQNDAVLATLGFDHLLGDRVTLAADVVGELQVGQSRLALPGPVHYDAPYRRIVVPTTIPETRDDVVNGSFGFKFSTGRGLAIVTNAFIPLNRGGLRPSVAYTGGLEYSF